MILTPQLAVEIYLHKLELENPKEPNSFSDAASLLKGHSVPVSKKYNVSAKTIRDIWNRRTWTFVTDAVLRSKGIKV